MFAYQRERAFGKDNPLRPEVEDYIEFNTYYNKNTLHTVKVTMANFSSYIFNEEGLTKFQDVNPRVMSRFIKHERARGLTNGNFIGHIKTFYDSNIVEGRFDMANPVIPRFHSQRGAPTEARPYTDKDLAFIWAIVESSDDVALKLAFAIGKECGLRVGEVCNIRLKTSTRTGKKSSFGCPPRTCARAPFRTTLMWPSISSLAGEAQSRLRY